MNWFGEKLGSNKTIFGSGGGGVGKYLSLKRSSDSEPVVAGVTEEPKKKRKLGFGDFEGW